MVGSAKSMSGKCSLRSRWVLGASLALVAATAVAGPLAAQKASPQIIAEERRDPAAGEVVIINRKKVTKRDPPDPYSSTKSKPLPGRLAKPKQATKPQAKKQAAQRIKRSDRPKVVRAASAPPPAAYASLPPLPILNRDTRSPSQSHLRQYARVRSTETEPHIRAQPSVPGSGDLRRSPRRERRYVRGYHEPEFRRRFTPRQRPWRWCRRLAWRCENGSEGACFNWRRRCTR